MLRILFYSSTFPASEIFESLVNIFVGQICLSSPFFQYKACSKIPGNSKIVSPPMVMAAIGARRLHSFEIGFAGRMVTRY